MKTAIVILAAMLPLVAACSKRPEITQHKTTTTSTAYTAPAPEPEVIEQRRSTTVTVQ